ncbi:transposase [Streptomyces sp. NPDC090493]|uniref:transposase n=1 Tax=Streptomyces sp. NPDC090493 TaxID=3365964 RepID=UPI0038272740
MDGRFSPGRDSGHIAVRRRRRRYSTQREVDQRVGTHQTEGVDGRHDLLQARPSRLFSAVREYTGRKDQPKSFGWRDFRDLIVRARIQLGGPIVLVWDNVRLHLTKPLRKFIDANAEWLTAIQLPTYAPGLNPTVGVWSLVKRDIGNLAAAASKTSPAP